MRRETEILVVMTVMITDRAGFLSEQNMVVWELLLGKQHLAFVVTREEVVITKSTGEKPHSEEQQVRGHQVPRKPLSGEHTVQHHGK